MMANFADPLEKYWSDEEDQLRKRGIDPMAVPQIEPKKLPTHRGSTTLHRGGGKVKFRKGGMVGKSMGCKSHVDWSK